MPAGLQTIQDLFGSLEAVMVNIFRLFESLNEITKEERQVLLDGKADELMILAKRKEALLNGLESNDESRRALTGQLAKAVGLDAESITLNNILEKLDSVDVEQISRLQQGILALQAEIRETNNGNYALATLNINRLDAVQSYILSLFSPPNYYRPTVPVPTIEPPTSWGMDHRA
jgi:flagellar biosynthesis/type III secretory pathway chaperone